MEKLYHYTSINNFALILKTHKIKFSRLDKVNDPTEGLVNDFYNLSPYAFISSWTSRKEEDLALWNMYTPNMRGVRIELELPLFNSNSIDDIEDLIFSNKEFLNEEKGYIIIGGKNEPLKIEYTNNIKLLRPSVLDETGVNIGSIGKHKRTIWAIEQESRYIIIILPLDKNIKSDHLPHRYERLIEKQTPPPIDSFFVKIKNSSYENMKIVCAPKLLYGDKEIIESLIKTYNPSAEFTESGMKGLIR